MGNLKAMIETQTAPPCPTIDANGSVDLEAYRVEQKLTWQELAARIGAKSAGQAQNWAQGEVRPSARRLDAIVKATGGRVSIFAMHQRRLAWERQNLQPMAVVEAVAGDVTTGGVLMPDDSAASEVAAVGV
jgi:DNA-binding transcriptional regulator YdaS (Cro superfamily)